MYCINLINDSRLYTAFSYIYKIIANIIQLLKNLFINFLNQLIFDFIKINNHNLYENLPKVMQGDL